MSTFDRLTEIFGEPISTFTREEAIEDGALVDVSKTAREAGFTIPVAMTADAWADCVAWSQEESQRKGGWPQDEGGRLWDVLTMLRFAARGSNESVLLFQLHRVPTAGESTEAQLVTLKSMIGSGDGGEPVITIMLPEED